MPENSHHTFSVRCSREVVDKLAAKLGRSGVSRSAYIEALVRADLDGSRKVDRVDATRQVEADAKLSSLLDQALVKKLKSDPDAVIASLDDKTLAQLIAQRSPKPKDQDQELQESYLSLSRSLGKLPDVPEVAKEANKAKARCSKLENELEFCRQELLFLRSKLKRQDAEAWPAFKQAMAAFRDRAMAYAKECAVRGLEVEDLRTLIVYASKGDDPQ